MDSSNTITPTPDTPNCCGAFTCLPFFVAGIVGLALVEFLLVLYLLERLLNLSSSASKSPVSDLKIENEDRSISVQGKAWVAPLPDVNLSKVILRQIRKDKKNDKDGQRDGARRGEGTKGTLEIAPMRRQAILKDNALFLISADGTVEEVSLEGCEVLSVSSSPDSSRKWGKKYPIRLHHSVRDLYRGSKTLLFFAESGYAKEAWCEAFRAMARTATPLSNWPFKTKREYREYTRVAEENMPYLTEFYATDEARDMDVKQKEKAEEQPKKRLLLKKLVRKASIGREHKEPKFGQVVDETRRRKWGRTHRHDDKDWKNKDTASSDEDHRGTYVSVAESASQVVDPNFDRSTSFEGLANGEASLSISGGNNPAPASTEKDSKESRDQVPATQQKSHKPKDEKAGKEIEQGVLCLNMIVARLYFDFNKSAGGLASVDRFFQRLLMKIRAPSYIKSISIKELDLGRHPPFATAVRMLPSDAVGALAVELDLEWHGGGHLTCETRLDLREQSTQENVAAQLTQSGPEGAAAAALLSGIRGEFDVASSESFSAAMQEGRQPGDEGSNKKGRIMQSVKSMMSRVAEQVSQVPLILKIRLVSLKGTAVLKLKAPPSDRVWFAFKKMPEIHFEPEPCIGEHRISSSALGRLIANQIKVQIRESVVLPYCEDFVLNWMVADKENWLPTTAFPFPFFDSQSSKAERELSKQNAEIQSNSSDENGRPSHQPLPPQSTHNGQNKPPKGQAVQGPSKAQKLTHFNHAEGYQPSTSAQEPNHGLVQPQRSSSDLLSKFSSPKPPRSASSDHLHAQSSVPKPPRAFSRAHLSALLSDPVQLTGSTVFSSASPLVSKESRPLLKDDESHKEETLGSAGDSEPGTSNMATDSRSKDCSSHSEGSASDSDVQFLATQVANPEEVKESVHVVPLSRRARMLSLSKKMGSRLDEGRRNVVEKLQHKRPDDSDGSGHSQSSGRWAHEAPFA